MELVAAGDAGPNLARGLGQGLVDVGLGVCGFGVEGAGVRRELVVADQAEPRLVG